MSGISHRLARHLEGWPQPERALEKLLAVMDELPVSIPKGLDTAEHQLSYLSGVSGLAYAAVTLDRGWQYRQGGYLLAETSGGLTALCPRPLGGYLASGETGEGFESVNRKNEARFYGSAWQVFSPLPGRYRSPCAAVWHSLWRECGALLGVLALLAAAVGGAGALLSLSVWQMLWEVLPGALPWYAVLPTLAAALLLGGGGACLALDLAHRAAERAAGAAVIGLSSRNAVCAVETRERLREDCMGAAGVLLCVCFLAPVAATALLFLGRGAASAGFLLVCGASLAVGCGITFRRGQRPPLDFLWGLAALWFPFCLARVWSAGLGQAQGAAYIAALLPSAAILLLLAREMPVFAAILRRGGVPSVADVRDARPPLVDCDGSLTVDEAAVGILHPVSLRLEPGEKVGIYGPVGGGKSTLLRLLSGTLPPSSGTVYCGGRDCAGVQAESLRRWVSLVSAAEEGSVALAVGRAPAAILADHITDRSTAEAVLAFHGTAVLVSARKDLLKGCGRIFFLSGGILRREGGGKDG